MRIYMADILRQLISSDESCLSTQGGCFRKSYCLIQKQHGNSHFPLQKANGHSKRDSVKTKLKMNPGFIQNFFDGLIREG